MVEVVFQLTKDANGKKLKQQYGQLWYYAPLDPDSSWARRLKDLIDGVRPQGQGRQPRRSIEGKEASSGCARTPTSTATTGPTSARS
jgi:hypothetical protein